MSTPPAPSLPVLARPDTCCYDCGQGFAYRAGTYRVTVSASPETGFDPRVNGTFDVVVPADSTGGSYQIYHESYDYREWDARLFVSYGCFDNAQAPCPAAYNQFCKCFSGALPAGRYAAINLRESFSAYGGGSYVREATFFLSGLYTPGIPQQSICRFGNYSGDTYYCDANVTLAVSETP